MQASRDLEGVKTDVIIQVYADRFMVLVTQIGKVGSLMQAVIPSTTPLQQALPNALPDPPASIQLTPLLGSPPSQHLATLQALYTSQIATLLWTEGGNSDAGERAAVVVGLALKKSAGNSGDPSESLTNAERNTFTGVMEMIKGILRK